MGASAFAGSTYVAQSDKNPAPVETSAVSLYGPEWTIDLFGTYAFTESTNEEILGDHGFGGGLAVNRFFTTNIGLGIEGQALKTQRNDDDVVGSAALNFFYRMPLGDSGWAPYVYVGGGVIFNTENTDFGDVADDVVDADDDNDEDGVNNNLGNNNGNDDDALLEGHAGVGVEYRITRNFGVFTDGRWTVVENAKNNFPSVRTGIRFAF
jgi:hypothetical protein